MSSPLIENRPEPFGCGYDVIVLPPQLGQGFDRELPHYDVAVAYGSSAVILLSWSTSVASADAMRLSKSVTCASSAAMRPS